MDVFHYAGIGGDGGRFYARRSRQKENMTWVRNRS